MGSWLASLVVVLLTTIFTTEIAAIKLDSFSFRGMCPTVITGYGLGIGCRAGRLVVYLQPTPLAGMVELANQP
jgi:hypothetical protein